MPPSRDATEALNEKRRRAVEMRLAGASLAAVRAATGLSAPTVIGAYKAFRAGGPKGYNTRIDVSRSFSRLLRETVK